ncbi:MAG: hypothetical protein H0W86_12900 [Armatimonadetes bacterium]|nr:hypothetical protein [Armatimonadota bacterium]
MVADFFIGLFLKLFGSAYSNYRVKLSEKQLAEGWYLSIDKGGFEYASWREPKSEQTAATEADTASESAPGHIANEFR